MNSFAVIILDREKILDLNNNKNNKDNKFKYIKKEIVSFTSNDIMKIKIDSNITNSKLKEIYLKKIAGASIEIILKILLLIISGSIITANLIKGIFNVTFDVTSFLVSAVIYYCYSYIVRYIYKPIGRQKIFASYMFPIYFVFYIIITVYNFIANSINKV